MRETEPIGQPVLDIPKAPDAWLASANKAIWEILIHSTRGRIKTFLHQVSFLFFLMMVEHSVTRTSVRGFLTLPLSSDVSCWVGGSMGETAFTGVVASGVSNAPSESELL